MQEIQEIIENPLPFLLTLCGYILGVAFVWRWRKEIGMNELWQISLVFALFSISGFIGCRWIGLLEKALIGVDGGKRLYGFIFIETFFVLVSTYIVPINRRALFDAYTGYIIITLFFARLCCYFSGCCEGTSIFGTQWKWPTRETELIFYIIAFVYLWKRIEKNELPGSCFPRFMIIYGVFRFIYEWFRAAKNLGLGFHVAHFWSIVCVMIGCSIYGELQAQGAKKKSNGRRRRM